MQRRGTPPLLVSVGLVGLLSMAGLALGNQGQGSSAPSGAGPGRGGHGTPAGWRFTWPEGDPVKGRAVFVKLECYSCHEVRGERFPAPSEAGKVGPELSAMGPLHEPEYFAEAILNPSAVIERGKGYEAPDGSSRMPSYNDSVTAQEVIDLVAFLRALKPPVGSGDPGGHEQHH
jgi:mono/diheme cytochrome c family protein